MCTGKDIKTLRLIMLSIVYFFTLITDESNVDKSKCTLIQGQENPTWCIYALKKKNLTNYTGLLIENNLPHAHFQFSLFTSLKLVSIKLTLTYVSRYKVFFSKESMRIKISISICFYESWECQSPVGLDVQCTLMKKGSWHILDIVENPISTLQVIIRRLKMMWNKRKT